MGFMGLVGSCADSRSYGYQSWFLSCWCWEITWEVDRLALIVTSFVLNGTGRN